MLIESDGGIHTVGIEGAMGHFGLELDRDGLDHERIAWRMTPLSECVLDADEDSLCDEQDLCPGDSPNDLDADGQCGLGAVVSQEADLVVSEIDAPHATAPFFEATVEVCNQGVVDSLPTTLSAFMSSREFDEGAIGPELDDLTFGTYPVPALAAAACFQQKLYSHGGDGQMYIHVIVDGENRVLEDIESNNTLSVPVLIGHGSDLVVEQIVAPPTGTNIQVDVRICNQGADWAGPTMSALMMSEDQAIDLPTPENPNTRDLRLGGVRVEPLSPGGCFEAHFAVSVPTHLGSEVFLGVVVDTDNQEFEMLESNNTRAVRFGVGSGPDVFVEGFVARVFGEYLEYSLDVCNQGAEFASSVPVSIVLSGDDRFDDLSDMNGIINDTLIDNGVIPLVAPGQCVPFQRTVYLGAVVSNGSHVGVVLDQMNLVAEVIKSNNSALVLPTNE